MVARRSTGYMSLIDDSLALVLGPLHLVVLHVLNLNLSVDDWLHYVNVLVVDDLIDHCRLLYDNISLLEMLHSTSAVVGARETAGMMGARETGLMGAGGRSEASACYACSLASVDVILLLRTSAVAGKVWVLGCLRVLLVGLVAASEKSVHGSLEKIKSAVW
jgi:hypothetical protein